MKPKLIRVTTVPDSLRLLLKGQLNFMVKQGFDLVAVSSSGKGLEDVGKFEKVRTIPVEMTRSITPFKDLFAVWKLYKIFKCERPQIVHTHTPKAGTVGMLAAKLAGVPNRLHTVAGLPLLVAEGKKRRLLDFVEKLTYRWATKVYPNSYGLYDIILENGYTTKNKLKVLGEGSSNGINTDFFNPGKVSTEDKERLRNALGLAADDFVYVFVGRLVGDKGINELVKAFLNRVNTKAKLILVGSEESDLDPLQPETLHAIKTCQNIIPVGSQKDVRPYFAISDALVFPSYREGFPNVVMEAGAMGLPCIVSDINGCNEIIVDGVNGMIVPVRDVDRLGQAMVRLLTDETFYDKLKMNSRPMIESRYKQHKIWHALLEEYNSLTKIKV